MTPSPAAAADFLPQMEDIAVPPSCKVAIRCARITKHEGRGQRLNARRKKKLQDILFAWHSFYSPIMEMGFRENRKRPRRPMYLLRQPAAHKRMTYSRPKNTTKTISCNSTRQQAGSRFSGGKNTAMMIFCRRELTSIKYLIAKRGQRPLQQKATTKTNYLGQEIKPKHFLD